MLYMIYSMRIILQPRVSLWPTTAQLIIRGGLNMSYSLNLINQSKGAEIKGRNNADFVSSIY